MASQLAKIGIKVKVNAAPKKIIYGLQGSKETSFGNLLLDLQHGRRHPVFWTTAPTRTARDKGLGRWNIGGYGDKEADALIEQSGESVDQKVREQAMQKSPADFSWAGTKPLYRFISRLIYMASAPGSTSPLRPRPI